MALDHAQDSISPLPSWVSVFLQAKLLGLAAVQRVRIWQQPRIQWLCTRDAKSKLFHIKDNGRRRRNFIPLLDTDAGQVTLQAHKQSELLKHFTASIGSSATRSCNINWESGTTLRSSGTIYMLLMCLSPRKKSRLQFLISLLVKHQALMGSQLTSLSTVGV